MRGWMILVLAILASVWFACGGDDDRDDDRDGPAASASADATFVGSVGCKVCHDDRHETWLTTAHAYSLRAPTDDVVEGDFHGKPIESEFFVATPYRSGVSGNGEPFIKVVGRDGRPDGDHKVTHIVGRSFEQAYLTTDQSGRWRVLPICWSIDRKVWEFTADVLEDIAGHVGAVPANYDSRDHVFNHGCGQCHATDYDVGQDVTTDTLHSTYLEGAVACESCHGPGSVHVAWHEADKGDESYAWPARLVHPKKDLKTPKEVMDSCGRCHYMHEWTYAIDEDPRVGYEQIAITLNYDQPGFFADGRLAGLSYHGSTMSQSACSTSGQMSCFSCHSMHSGKRFAMKWQENDDKQCTQCHEESKFATEEHMHHATVATRCVDCHMPKFLAGVLHFLRDHAIRPPAPILTERHGADNVPNACNRCHQDKSATWARQWREKWWGPTDPLLVQNVDLVMRLRRDRDAVPTGDLIAAASLETSRNWFRLTALNELTRKLERWRAPETRAFARRMLASDNTEILQVLCTAFASHPDREAVTELLRLTSHPVRTVRVLAGYAAIRAGWRGGFGVDEAMARLNDDAKAMLVRQRQLVSALEPIAYFADVVGTSAELDDYYKRIQRLYGSQPGRWRFTALELLHRRGRQATEAGEHNMALDLYGELQQAGMNRIPELLQIDAADSLAALGNRPMAEQVWKRVLASARPKSVEAAIARARLDARTGRAELESWETKLVAAPWGGEILRRVRWSLKAISGS